MVVFEFIRAVISCSLKRYLVSFELSFFCFNHLFLFKILFDETVILLANIFCKNWYFLKLFNFCTLNLLSTLLKLLNLFQL